MEHRDQRVIVVCRVALETTDCREKTVYRVRPEETESTGRKETPDDRDCRAWPAPRETPDLEDSQDQREIRDCQDQEGPRERWA